jgi:hypothetical protein
VLYAAIRVVVQVHLFGHAGFLLPDVGGGSDDFTRGVVVTECRLVTGCWHGFVVTWTFCAAGVPWILR